MILNIELPKDIKDTQINTSIKILKSNCINFILLSPYKAYFIMLLYPKFKNKIHRI